jgi:spore coat protein U-like protein
MKRNIILSFFALLPLLALAPRADGALNCSFDSVTGVNFGAYDVFGASPTKATGTITYSCKGAGGGTLMMMDLSPGSGTFANRTLRSGGNILNYNLYPDAANSQVWGDGTGTYHYVVNPGNGAGPPLTVYGTILPGQDVGVGSYTDSIRVTMNF